MRRMVMGMVMVAVGVVAGAPLQGQLRSTERAAERAERAASAQERAAGRSFAALERLSELSELRGPRVVVTGERARAEAADRYSLMTAQERQEDPAAREYRDARRALNARRYNDAARMFAEIREEFTRSGHIADSYYWEAFARFRAGGRDELRRAVELLNVQRELHADAGTRADADALSVRIEAQLARRGDAAAAVRINEVAAGPCDEDQEVRLAALSALLNMNAERAVPILEEVLQSRDECSVELRRRAVFLVSQKMSEGTVDILLDLAHRNPDPDPEVREQAVFWLHQVDSPEALDALEAILTESRDSELQERAIFAISQRQDDRSVEILKSYATRDDVDHELRENAIFWISQNPRAGGAAFLIDLYPELDDDELRERAIFGIAQAGGADARDWLLERAMDSREDVEVRKNALFWAGQSGDLAADELQQLYRTVSDIEMKEQVIFVASQRSETAFVDLLMEIATDEEDGELRKKAIFWLGQSKDPRVAEFLLSLMGRGAVRR